MNATAVKPKEQLCQAVSRVDELCDHSAQQYCPRCGQWFRVPAVQTMDVTDLRPPSPTDNGDPDRADHRNKVGS